MSEPFALTPDTAALRNRLYQLKQRYGGPFKVFPIGRSALGRDIMAAGVGDIRGATLLVGGVGGQEWAVTRLLVGFLEELIVAMKEGRPLGGIEVRHALRERAVMVVPCLNPDGVELSAHGETAAGGMAATLTRLAGEDGFSGWQANGRGVDLRCAFDAGWSPTGQPSAQGYAGRFPMSEPECRAVANLCTAFSMRQLVALSQGEREVGYRFAEPAPRSRLVAQMLCSAGDARLSDRSGAAGLKDWFIHETRRPAYALRCEGLPGPGPLPDGLTKMLLLALLL